jgi:hypothetical protein
MTLAAFERGVARAVDYLMKDDAAARALVAQFTKSKPAVIDGAGMPSWTNELSVTNVDVQMQLMIKHGLLQKPQNVNELIWKSPPAQK